MKFITTLLAAMLLITACDSKKETPTYKRVEGLKEPDESSAAPPPASGAGEVTAPALNPGKPDSAGNSPTTDTVSAPPSSKVLQGGNKLQVAGIAFTIPDGWTQEKPASSMRAAQYALPGEAGPAEMAVFYFGPKQGGTLEENVKRWAKQFTNDDPTTQALPADVATMENDGLRIAAVKTFGTYDPGSMGPMGPASAGPKKNYALFGLVIEGGPEGSVFVKITGPKATVDSQAKNLEDFTRSTKKSQFK